MEDMQGIEGLEKPEDLIIAAREACGWFA